MKQPAAAWSSAKLDFHASTLQICLSEDSEMDNFEFCKEG